MSLANNEQNVISTNSTPANYDPQHPHCGLSFSMWVESKDDPTENTRHFSSIEKRARLKWVDDNSVTACRKCKEKFGYFNRKHHCRLCGQIFCDSCSTRRSTIPKYIARPIPDFEEDVEHVPVRVCENDYKKLSQIKQLETLIIVFSKVDLDIYDFRNLIQATIISDTPKDHSQNSDLIDLRSSSAKNTKNTTEEGREQEEGEEREEGNEDEGDRETVEKTNWEKLTEFHTNRMHVDNNGNKDNGFVQSGKIWNEVANYHLSKIFKMQYYMPNVEYTEYDRKNLWANRYYFIGHSKWMIQLLRSINFRSHDGLDKIAEVKNLMRAHLNPPQMDVKERKRICWELMCTRHCFHGFMPSDAIQMLDDSPVPELRTIVVQCLEKCSVEELSCYLLLLVHYIAEENARLDEAILGHWLITKAAEHLTLANELYWLLNNNILNIHSKKKYIYQYYLDEWHKHVPEEMQQIVLNGTYLCNTLEKEGEKHYRFNISETYRKTLSKYGKTIFPTNPELGKVTIDHDKITVKQSITRPVVIPGVTEDGKKLRILHKKEDVRKDKIVMDVIRLMNIILTKELGLDLNIVTYNVLSLSAESGLIQMVDSSDTLYSISKKRMTLLNYALDNNENIIVKDLRQRFVRSCASYCVITFLLGIGDRHLENIMMTKDGQLFHIDYGFVLGYDPKPMRIPMMRISSEMINALGGENSKYYAEFKTLCNQIYGCLRRHVNLFYSMLHLLVTLEPPVQNSVPFNEKRLVEEVMKRFIPGEGTKQAKIQLDTRIANSTQSYSHAVIDFFHYHAQENRAFKFVSGLVGKLSKIKII